MRQVKLNFETVQSVQLQLQRRIVQPRWNVGALVIRIRVKMTANVMKLAQNILGLHTNAPANEAIFYIRAKIVNSARAILILVSMVERAPF